MLTLVPSSFSLAAGFLRPLGCGCTRGRLGIEGGPAPGLGPTAICGSAAPVAAAVARAAGSEPAVGPPAPVATEGVCGSSPASSSVAVRSGTLTADRQ